MCLEIRKDSKSDYKQIQEIAPKYEQNSKSKKIPPLNELPDIIRTNLLVYYMGITLILEEV